MTILSLRKHLFSTTSRKREHHSPNRQTTPESTESNLLVDPSHGRTTRLSGLLVGIQLADHDICRVRNDCAEDTSQVTTCESNSGLRGFGILVFGLGEGLVDHFDNSLERGEFLQQSVWSIQPPCVPDLTIIVYGICLAQSGPIPLYNPPTPSAATILLMPSKVPLAKGGIVVCIRTFTASNGHSPMSAKNSADAEPAR